MPGADRHFSASAGSRGPLLDVAALLERLAKIQALYDGAATDGERQAAAAAADRVRTRLAAEGGEPSGGRDPRPSQAHSKRQPEAEPLVEYQLRIDDAWSRKLFIGIARHHGVHPYRYRGQRRTSIVVRTSKRILDHIVYPHYLEAVDVLRAHFDAIADRVIREALHVATDDADLPIEPDRRALTQL